MRRKTSLSTINVMRPLSFVSTLRNNNVLNVGTFNSCRFDRLYALPPPFDVNVANDPIFHLFWFVAGLWNMLLATVFWDTISKPPARSSTASQNQTNVDNQEEQTGTTYPWQRIQNTFNNSLSLPSVCCMLLLACTGEHFDPSH